MILDEVQKLPLEIQEYILDPNIAAVNAKIADTFVLNFEQTRYILDMEMAIILKQIDPIDLPARLEDMDRANKYDLRAISLEIATKILWPIQEYLGNVDRLILRLGGKVPKLVHMRRAPLQNKSFPETESGGVQGMMSQYDDFKNLHLSRNKIVDKDGRYIPGTVDNWIKDYIHMVGAGRHDSLQRSKYLSDSFNARSLNPQEMESLRHFLLSLDEDKVVDFQRTDDYLLVRAHRQVGKTNISSVDDLIADYQSRVDGLVKGLLPENIIMSEAGGQSKKLGDVLWSALGNGDSVKAISALRSMQQQSSIISVLWPDIRYKNILKRFVSVKYGRDVEDWVAQNTDLDLSLRLYLELFLSDKLNLPQDEAALYALYISRLKPVLESPIYLDQQEGELHWRELRVEAGKLVWA